MNRLNLSDLALEILQINRDFNLCLKNPHKNKIRDFKLHTFEQIWGNTSGGFETIGGSAMTTQRVYVFVPSTESNDEDCLIFFGGKYAYSVPLTCTLIEDIKEQNIAGVTNKSRYMKE